MAIPVLILGESGTGKSTSMRNFKSSELAVVNVVGKPLPFRGHFDSITSDSYREIKKYIRSTTKKSIVIDDAQYLMANEFMRRATERGYDKFTEIAYGFWDLINEIVKLPYDVIVYVMAHIERDSNGNEKIKTIGKMLDEKITVEGMFTVVLKTLVKDGVYSFSTVNNGNDTVKAPIGLFSSAVIDNDLKAVDVALRKYYEVDIPFTTHDLDAKANDERIEKHEEVPVVKTDELKLPGSPLPSEHTKDEAIEDNAEKPRRRRKRD